METLLTSCLNNILHPKDKIFSAIRKFVERVTNMEAQLPKSNKMTKLLKLVAAGHEINICTKYEF